MATCRKRVSTLGISNLDNNDSNAVPIRRDIGRLQMTAQPTPIRYPVPGDVPIRERFAVFLPSQPDSNFDASGRNRSAQSYLPSGAANARPLSFLQSSSDADAETIPKHRARKLGRRAFDLCKIGHNIQTPCTTPQVIPKADPGPGVTQGSPILQETSPRQPRSPYPARTVKRRPAPPLPTPETLSNSLPSPLDLSFLASGGAQPTRPAKRRPALLIPSPETLSKPLPPPLDLRFLASGRDQSARSPLASGPRTARPFNFVESSTSSPSRSTIPPSQYNFPRDGQNQLPQANHVAKLESDASPTTLSSTLDELVYLSIPPSRLTILDSSEVGCGRYGEVLLATLDSSSQTPTSELLGQEESVNA
ncbi:hypothetical protein M407DRAFT_211886 [Tulasnella calospora MUT 4182]|uniref:Uncharacterized protein n=1 Tax=Tulasnella calospora MUT 4182 TaxID=1051891 RepID=A0A0C3PZT2_9AGAM|nr:hypothetical protein M407DRAFT_211886 [Tulasnella calospora MUT 4182]